MSDKELKNKIQYLETEIDSLEKKFSDPLITKDSKTMKSLSSELAYHKEELKILKEMLIIRKQKEESQKLLLEESDQDIIDLAKQEIRDLEDKEEKINSNYSEFINMDREKYNSVIIEIRAGTGGEESNLFAAEIFRMYSKFAESKNWNVYFLSKNQTGTGGFKEIISQIDGEDVYRFFRNESGVHRVQRIPETESSGRIHTSAISVVVYPLIETSDIHIDPNDLKIDVYRASGPGGQSVNTTDSAVRITHLPTNTTVTCQDEKSQHKNKKKAMSILLSRLESLKRENEKEKISKVRKESIRSGDRSAKIRTYNYPQDRVTDHRIKKSWHNLGAILDGDLDQIIETLNKDL